MSKLLVFLVRFTFFDTLCCC